MGRLFTCGGTLLIPLAFAIVAGAQNLRVLQVQPGFYMIGGAGANVAVQTGPDGVVVVDSGSASTAEAVLTEIKKLSSEPIRYIINTSLDRISR